MSYFLSIFKEQVKIHKTPLSVYRFFFRWRKSLLSGASSMNDRQAWITFPALVHLAGFIQPEHKVFEYGGGGSTLFFLDRGAEVVTVEHQEEWFGILKDHVRVEKDGRWHPVLQLPTPGNLVAQPDPADPLHYASADAASADHHYKNYVAFIDTYPVSYFDLILIDGRARPSCIIHAARHLKTGGLLVLDNAERDYYFKKTSYVFAAMELILSKTAPGPYSKEFTRTYIWKKK